MNDRDNSIENALVLLSGGLDSTVALAVAQRRYKLKTVLFFEYNQHALERERSAVRRIAGFYQLPIEYVKLPWLGEGSSSSLTREVLQKEDDFRNVEVGQENKRDPSSAWVENRNGIFLNIAAAFASWKQCSVIITGFNREESRLFPDNSSIYVDAVNRALDIGVRKDIRVESPTLDFDKKRIAKEGMKLSIPWKYLWSCYGGGKLMCGKCYSCMKLKSAIEGMGAAEVISFAEEE
ncbi:MAG: 7-cyano-7-deazaguanine synthase [Candidatus Krumholzibacteriota bacterium]|nr:7-cyano-7-deazaguanine synthase [Candidatus Krumholzibacteriota bacterium]